MPGGRIALLVRRFGRDDGGAATIEFVIIFPLLMYFFFALGEVGTLMARQVMLERGVDMAVRDVRLGLTPGVTHDQLKARICDSAYLLASCEDVLRLDLTPLVDDSGTNFPVQPMSCVDRDATEPAAITLTPGGQNDIVVVRACLIADPIFPGSGFAAAMPRLDDGGYAIIVTSAYMNEPGG